MEFCPVDAQIGLLGNDFERQGRGRREESPPVRQFWAPQKIFIGDIPSTPWLMLADALEVFTVVAV